MKANYYEQPFLRYFLDAILLTEMAAELPHLIPSRHGAIARGSIMAATLSIEAAANSLLEPLQAPKAMLRLLDQAHVLDKFEMVLFATQPEKTFVRGVKPVQAINELFQVRNNYVHPRSRDTEVTERQLGEGTITIRSTANPTNTLRLPDSPERWGVTHSRRVLEAVSEFLTYFLVDLCEMEPQEIQLLLLSSLKRGDRQRLLLTSAQRDILSRAYLKHDSNLRIAGLIAGLDASARPAPTRTLLFVYSWAKGGTQLHEQKKLLSVDDTALSSEMLVSAAQRFLIWFAEAEATPYGRHLLMFEIFDEDHAHRYASFRQYLPEPAEGGDAERTTHRPIGTIPGVERHLFLNGVLGARISRPDGVVILQTVLDSGNGREFRLKVRSALELLEGIRLNRHPEWASEGVTVERPAKVETKGRDFEVEQSDIVTFDPTSRTAFWTYRAVSGQLVQANMKPATLMAIEEVIRNALLEPEGEQSKGEDESGG